VTPRTLTAPPTDRTMWRRLIARVHPDAGGDGELFIWVRHLQEHVAGDTLEDRRASYQRREPPPHHTTGERIPYEEAYRKAEDFADLTRQAVAMAAEVETVFARLLLLLDDCEEADEADVAGFRAMHQGASYKQLAYIAHLAGLDRSARSRWYRIAEQMPLAQRHAGHIVKRLKEDDF
jgi:hypothetical protein